MYTRKQISQAHSDAVVGDLIGANCVRLVRRAEKDIIVLAKMCCTIEIYSVEFERGIFWAFRIAAKSVAEDNSFGKTGNDHVQIKF